MKISIVNEKHKFKGHGTMADIFYETFVKNDDSIT